MTTRNTMSIPTACAAAALAAGLLLAACGGSDSAATLEDLPATGSPAPSQQEVHDHDRDHDHGGEAHGEHAPADLGPAISPATGYEDPVCRMTVAEDARVRHTHDGVTYGFCSEACKRAFAEDPDAYLIAMEE